MCTCRGSFFSTHGRKRFVAARIIPSRKDLIVIKLCSGLVGAYHFNLLRCGKTEAFSGHWIKFTSPRNLQAFGSHLSHKSVTSYAR